ncbi:MAG: hypothetical protein WD381_03870 [Balneolaceae bacterium]
MISTIKKIYPNAEKGDVMTSQCMEKLNNDHQFDSSKTILGTSVCSDEIVRSATNFRTHIGNQNPFTLGGLAGFPFTGLTGFKAFAGHIPDDGFAIIEYGPHIGISDTGQTGMVVRDGQALETTCCGALMATLDAFKSEKKSELDQELDYQQWKIAEELEESRSAIVNEDEPLIVATDHMFSQIDNRVKTLLEQTSSHFKNKKVALIGGIIINTDFGHSDWFDLREFEVQSF